jgi:CRISPR/Cas system CSM-associated protein Csm3 (group 7 of RAMP superfamily)
MTFGLGERRPEVPVIKIELRSDLCVSSGEGFTTAIDADMSYDRYGLPCIPARRLKGCFRDAAQLIGLDEGQIAEMFGETGQSEGGQIRFSNAAVLENYDEIVNELDQNEGMISPQEMLSLFTYTRARTAIEKTGVAKRESLRLMRIVKECAPIAKSVSSEAKNAEHKPLTFFLTCDLGTIKPEYFERVCKATRNIGLNRTRGLGAVRCTLLPGPSSGTEDPVDISGAIDVTKLSDEEEYVLELTLKNTSPLIVAKQNSDESSDYINGTAVLGCLAWRFLKSRPKRAVKTDDVAETDDTSESDNTDERSRQFTEIFLTDAVKFSNLYPAIENPAQTFGQTYPIPLCYVMLKSDGTIINTSLGTPNNDKLESLKNTFIALPAEAQANEKACFVKTKLETIYHHARQQSLLYTHKAISTGQFFKGTIAAKGKYIKILAGLIEDEPCLRIGKSKGVQYAECKIVKLDVRRSQQAVLRPTIQVCDETIVVWLKSDLLLMNGGIYSSEVTDLLATLECELENCVEQNGAAEMRISRLDPEEDISSFAYKTIMGYSGIWNLQKPHLRAFGAGSVLFLKVSGAGKLPRSFYLGEKQNEGFGMCELMRVSEMPEISEKPGSAFSYRQDRHDNYRYLSEYQMILKDREVLDSLKSKAYESSSRQLLDITSSLLGRVMLMLDQAEDWEDFKERVCSIRDEGSRGRIDKFINSIIDSIAKQDRASECEKSQNNEADWIEQSDELKEAPLKYAGSDWKTFWGTVFRIQRYKLKSKEASPPTASSTEEGS